MFETLIFNAKQRGLAFMGKPPIYCHYPNRKQFCMGASDDREDWCDTCVRIEKIQFELIMNTGNQD